MIRHLLLLLLSICTAISYGQSAHQLLRSGDTAYEREDFLSAEEDYRKANDIKPSMKGEFNLGNAVYRQERYEEAVQHYESTIASAKNDIEKANASFNLGNALLKMGKLDPAIEAYKTAVKLNPEDEDILKNLYIAKLLMQQEQKQQQQEEQQQQDKEEKQEQQENQEEQQQEQQQNPNEEQQENQSNGQEQDIEEAPENEGKGTPEPQELSKEDALKLLDVIENEEKAVQEKLRKGKGSRKKPKKDW